MAGCGIAQQGLELLERSLPDSLLDKFTVLEDQPHRATESLRDSGTPRPELLMRVERSDTDSDIRQRQRRSP